MGKTRLSLYYLATYLWLGGIGLLFAPTLAVKLLLSPRTLEKEAGTGQRQGFSDVGPARK